ncbi:MAG: bis(5'-nucleosyl)-tetraphosphatase (symmetrical) YqeK [Clostridia bacterium]|nr:bis(5'-nucleosyl)-tetraphosphatase (symmetrical) YqeK [Clostridia bacterium]
MYRDGAADTRTRDQQFIEIIRSRLGDYRFRHSLCVAQEARRLARLHGADPDKAYTAGILHDIMKDTDPNAQLQILEDFGILLDGLERQSPTLWHARSGEAFLRHILCIGDEDVLRAVRYHTTGRAGMTLLEQVLFVADFTSADRDYPDVDVMRRLADESLTAAIKYGIDYTIRDLLDRDRAVHPDTVAAYNEIVLSEANGGQANESK